MPLTTGHEDASSQASECSAQLKWLGEDPGGIMTDSKESEADRWLCVVRA